MKIDTGTIMGFIVVAIYMFFIVGSMVLTTNAYIIAYTDGEPIIQETTNPSIIDIFMELSGMVIGLCCILIVFIQLVLMIPNTPEKSDIENGDDIK